MEFHSMERPLEPPFLCHYHHHFNFSAHLSGAEGTRSKADRKKGKFLEKLAHVEHENSIKPDGIPWKLLDYWKSIISTTSFLTHSDSGSVLIQRNKRYIPQM